MVNYSTDGGREILTGKSIKPVSKYSLQSNSDSQGAYRGSGTQSTIASRLMIIDRNYIIPPMQDCLDSEDEFEVRHEE